MTPEQRTARNAEIVTLYRAGRSQQWLARRFGLSRSGIFTILRLAQVHRLDGGAHVSGIAFGQARERARLRFKHRHSLKLHEARP